MRVRGTILACDATSGSDLIFLSHARALDARAARALPRPRSGRRQVLTTELTLALLGTPGERLRPHALLASPGRPFALGPLRLELLSSTYMPGAASLLCDTGSRRVIYAGPVGAGPPTVRPANAVCLDATFGSRRFSFPDPAAALADLERLVAGALAAGRAPLVLVDVPGTALLAAGVLAAAGVGLRGHRSVLAAAAAFTRAGLPAPAVQRFEGPLRRGEALLWPREARQAPRLGALGPLAVVLASPWASDPEAAARARADHAVALASSADFEGLLRYVEATGAREVALRDRGPGDDLMPALHARGIDVYPLGPPRQIGLFPGVP